VKKTLSLNASAGAHSNPVSTPYIVQSIFVIGLAPIYFSCQTDAAPTPTTHTPPTIETNRLESLQCIYRSAYLSSDIHMAAVAAVMTDMAAVVIRGAGDA
jgi:hypothetical protein